MTTIYDVIATQYSILTEKTQKENEAKQQKIRDEQEYLDEVKQALYDAAEKLTYENLIHALKMGGSCLSVKINKPYYDRKPHYFGDSIFKTKIYKLHIGSYDSNYSFENPLVDIVTKMELDGIVFKHKHVYWEATDYSVEVNDEYIDMYPPPIKA